MPEPTHRRLRAPTSDGFALIDPPLSEAAALIERNRAIGERFDQVAGFASDFRTVARIRLLSSANLRNESQPVVAELRKPLVLSGHQPELFHPGVWLKNFVLSALSASVGGTGINLVIDNDIVRSTAIHVPMRADSLSEVTSVPFDAPGDAIPWECRNVIDPACFEHFTSAVQHTFAPFSTASSYKRGMLLDLMWPHALAAFREQRDTARQQLAKITDQTKMARFVSDIVYLGTSLSTARHRVEREIGLKTREVELSALAMDQSFLGFADYLFVRHRDLHAHYNAALADYRIANHIRSRAHPVPELSQDDEWYELPFWVWSLADFHRRPVFLREVDGGWDLTDRGDIRVAWRGAGRDFGELWIALLERGMQLRPRALITTMYARLVLSDLFIHGIGGAKYDEVTDLIIRRFFGIEPPAYITATATFRLPIERPQVTLDDVRRSALRIREARYRPEAFVRDPLVSGEPELAENLAALAAEKREYLDRHDLRRCEEHVFAQLDRMNRAMHDWLAPVERELRAQHAELLEQLKQSQLLGSREFSFVLFPSEILPARLLDLCKV